MRPVLRTSISALAFASFATAAVAQNTAPSASQASSKRPLTPTEIRNWNSIRQNALSADGKWFAYVVGSAESDATLYLRGTAQNATERRISLGNGGGSVTMSDDSKWIGYLVNPPRPPAGRGGRAAGGGNGGRGGRGGGGGEGAAPDSATAPVQSRFVLMNLASGDTVSFPGIRRFSFNSEKPTWVVMQGGAAGPAAPAGGRGDGGGRGGPPAGGGGGAQAGGGADILLYNLVTREPVTNMGRVNQYAFNDNGDLLAYTMENPDQLGNAVQIRDMKTGAVKALETDAVLYRHLDWVDSSRALAVMRGKVQTTGARDTLFSLRVFRGVTANGATRAMTFTPESRSDFPIGMKLASERAPRYSNDLTMVFFGVREGLKAGVRANLSPLVTPGAPGMGGTINQTAGGRGAGGNAAQDSVPSLILWHAKDARLQSQQIVQESADRAFNYLVEYRFDTDKFIRLTDDSLRNVTVTANDRFAYGSDNRAYQQNASFSGRNYSDVYVVDLKTGARKMLWKKRPGGLGAISPEGKKALFWGTDGHYWVLDLATFDSVNITKTVPTSFVNTEDDHNWIFPPAIGARGWSKDGSSVLLYDNWDIWKVSSTATAAAVNLTGDGKKSQTRYRTIYAWNTDEDEDDAAGGGGGGGGRGGRGGGGGGGAGVDLTKPLYIGTYGEWTKKEGIAQDRAGQARREDAHVR